MGTLRSVQDHRVFMPGAHATVGRASSCDLVLRFEYISSTHAALRWNGSAWEVRDLHSRNGTFVNGRRLVPGERVLLTRGGRLAFGASASTWELLDDAPPRARAVAADGRAVTAVGGLIELPEAEAVEVQVFEAAEGRWVCDSAEREFEVGDGDVVVAGGLAWTMRLPAIVPRTVDPAALPVDTDEHRLTVRVSADEDYIELELAAPGGEVRRLEHRAHHPLILLLARARIADVESSPRERGWIYVEVALKELDIDPGRLALHIFRARQAFAAAGWPGAASIIERRRGSGQIRLGPARPLVVRL